MLPNLIEQDYSLSFREILSLADVNTKPGLIILLFTGKHLGSSCLFLAIQTATS